MQHTTVVLCNNTILKLTFRPRFVYGHTRHLNLHLNPPVRHCSVATTASHFIPKSACVRDLAGEEWHLCQLAVTRHQQHDMPAVTQGRQPESASTCVLGRACLLCEHGLLLAHATLHTNSRFSAAQLQHACWCWYACREWQHTWHHVSLAGASSKPHHIPC